MKETLVLDIECYGNYFLVMFKNIATGNKRAFEMFEDQPLDTATIGQILKYYTIVSFNGINYDMPVLACALKGATNEQLKHASDTIIVGGIKSWMFETQFGVKIPATDHIDIIEVAPGMSSLKIYSGRLHAPKMQDLPIDPSEMISPEQRELLKTYCGNDLDNTHLLFNELRPQIELREKMSAEYGMDLRSKSDAQIAEAVIVAQAKKQLGMDIYRPSVPPGTTFKYIAPEFIQFQSNELKDLLAQVQQLDFMVNKKGSVDLPGALNNRKIKIGQGIYRLGLGGIHSSEERKTYCIQKDERIWDVDCVSYYPAIILNNRYFPEHMGSGFLTIYQGLVNRRVAAKAAGDKVTSDALKITVNGSFGKLGSKWSKLYSPRLLIQTTITGQLSLLQLIEALENSSVKVLSANTDGISIHFHESQIPALLLLLSQWEKQTSFVLERSEYTSLHIANVNNYLAIKPNGEVKTKGAFAPAGLQKNPTNTICVEAVTEFLINNTPIRDTILGCTDIRKFVTIRQVKGGGEKDGRYLGKAVRWYYSVNATGTIAYKENGNTVARSEGAMPLMELPAEFPSDVNYDWYIDEARLILNDVGYNGLFI